MMAKALEKWRAELLIQLHCCRSRPYPFFLVSSREERRGSSMAADPSPRLPSLSPWPAERSPSAPSCDGTAWGAAGCRGSTAPTCCSPRLVSHHWTRRFLGFSHGAALVLRPGAAVLCRCAATAVHQRAEGEEEGKRGGHRGAWCSAPPFWCFCSGSTGSAVVHGGFTALLLPLHHQHHLRRCARGSPGGPAG